MVEAGPKPITSARLSRRTALKSAAGAIAAAAIVPGAAGAVMLHDAHLLELDRALRAASADWKRASDRLAEAERRLFALQPAPPHESWFPNPGAAITMSCRKAGRRCADICTACSGMTRRSARVSPRRVFNGSNTTPHATSSQMQTGTSRRRQRRRRPQRRSRCCTSALRRRQPKAGRGFGSNCRSSGT